MNVAFFAYRDWGKRIIKDLYFFRSLEFYPRWNISSLDDADVVIYYGWSEIIPKEIYENKLCLILHPSPLPKYRGGSPLQHQIINGEKKSAVTICKVTDKLDAGDIYSQTEFSLEGTLNDIFDRIIEIGVRDTVDILSRIDFITPIPQDESQATTFKRRTPEESEIKLENFNTAEQLHNFIRALNDPYPNAFIVCKDGKKLYLTGSHL